MNEKHWFLDNNPLLDGLPQINDTMQLTQLLIMNPLQGLDINSLGFFQQDALLTMKKDPFCPVPQSIRTAMTILGMLFGNYQRNNPNYVHVRRELWQLLEAVQNKTPVVDLPTIESHSVFIIKGITGVGKSCLIKSLCRILPQVIERDLNEAAGGMKFKQLVWLHVEMAHSGSRSGFLSGIATAMDEALGTDYSSQLLKRGRGIDAQIDYIVARLRAHYTGIIFMNEGQLQNMISRVNGGDLKTFLLNIINRGIPLVLIGNPTAFKWLGDFSQNIRRLSELPPEYFHPIGAIGLDEDNDENWEAAFSGISSYYVLKESIIDMQECSRRLRDRSGGIPGVALSLWCKAQRLALHKQLQHIEPEDIDLAFNDEDFDRKMKDLAQGFHLKDPIILSQFEDVPWEHYATAWGKASRSKSNDLTAEKSTTSDREVAKPQKLPSRNAKKQFDSEKKKKERKNKQRDELNSNLPEEDIRKEGLAMVHLGGLDAMLNNLS
nr:ATP-binding protein [uncultured Pseudogulbenkiania sp.]